MSNVSTEVTKQQAQTICNGIKEEFIDCFLVKPLDPIKVKKEFSKPVTKSVSKDENGIEAADYDQVETEIKEVDSEFRKGIVIKIPLSYCQQLNDAKTHLPVWIELGDTVIFRDASSRYYDLFKDSKLVNYYNIVAVEKC